MKITILIENDDDAEQVTEVKVLYTKESSQLSAIMVQDALQELSIKLIDQIVEQAAKQPGVVTPEKVAAVKLEELDVVAPAPDSPEPAEQQQ
jgi:hypothetical protein